ncbi:MAG TPA: GNAT family N-acetyltransferase [Bacillales bacterium]|nr:GNAT family N-acetyltransferase [Bacillales bacterium]
MQSAIKPLSACTMNEILRAWNDGFEGYFTDVRMNVDQFVKRMAFEDLSASHSFLLFEGTAPIGIVMNGIRQIEDTKVAWNGGTGVAKAYRGKGIGSRLIEESLDIYKKEDVELATLESIAENRAAIRLYESAGYDVTDRLRLFNKAGAVNFENDGHFHFNRGPASHVAGLSFYQKSYPWQNHWQSLKDGQSIIVKNKEHPVAYALFKQSPDQSTTVLYQCEVDPDFPDPKGVIGQLLSNVFTSGRNAVFDMPESNTIVTGFLENNDFKMQLEQVFMVRTFEG